MRPVPLANRPSDTSALLRWCADMIGTLCRASQIDTPDQVRNFNTPVALADAATVAIDWSKAGSFSLTLAGSRTLGNPSSPRPGEWRHLNVVGTDATPRTLSFDTQYGGVPPSLTDITSTKTYLLKVYCVSATLFVVEAVDSSP